MRAAVTGYLNGVVYYNSYDLYGNGPTAVNLNYMGVDEIEFTPVSLDRYQGPVRFLIDDLVIKAIQPGPSGLTATLYADGNGKVILNWYDNSFSDKGFQIERATDSMQSQFTLIKTTDQNVVSYVDAPIPDGTIKRSYRVRAKFADGRYSDYSTLNYEMSFSTRIAHTPNILCRCSMVDFHYC